MTYIAYGFMEELDNIQREHKIEEWPGSSGYQLPADTTQSRAIKYAKTYGIKHACELEDAVAVVKKWLQQDVNVIDIGCGPGMSSRVLQGLSFNVKRYFGIDHARNQIWLARQLNIGAGEIANFSASLALLPVVEAPLLIIMNHICHQNNVSETDLHRWADNLKKMPPYRILSIEPQMGGEMQAKLLSIFRDHGRTTRELCTERTKSQFKADKITKVIAVD
jgi:SAM-dependent methyltransferase